VPNSPFSRRASVRPLVRPASLQQAYEQARIGISIMRIYGERTGWAAAAADVDFVSTIESGIRCDQMGILHKAVVGIQ
jgi:hypothetical protein